MYRDAPLMSGETFHVYNRGANKQKIFTSEADYRRFVLLMYLANHSGHIHLSNLLSSKKYQGESLIKIFQDSLADKSLVDILAYSLMPNHFHMVVRPKKDGSLSDFMKRLLTGYSMYFNIKYDHSGVLFQGPFKSKHVDSESYFRYIFAYIHLNALDLFEPRWKEEKIKDTPKARVFMEMYPYSSFFDYSVGTRPEGIVLSREVAPDFLASQNDLEELIAYFQQGESLIF